MDLYLTNSLTRKKGKFIPLNPPHVSMYTCGMTVYDYAHIGHGRKYVGDDILRRVLTFNGYLVTHVQNVTDVGHLASDADEGDDKIEKGAKKLGRSVWEVAEFFSKHFYSSMDKLNVLRPTVICKATEHIPEQIDLVKKLVEKDFAYDTPEAVYFDVSKFPSYGQIFGQRLEEKRTGARAGVKKGEHKKNPYDFALWFKRVGRFKDHAMHWDSPWGDGFPGWHIECSAMSMKYLGEQIDIHTGGEDHLPIHHPNEIAQSEAATGRHPFVRFWVHHAFLKVEGKKMSKSLGNIYTVEDVKSKSFEPLALRYLYLTTHYRDTQNFTWEALASAQSALNNLKELVMATKIQSSRTTLSSEKSGKVEEYSIRFNKEINDDLNTPKALAIVWEALKSNIPSEDKYDLALSFDEVLGLRLSDLEITLPKKIELKESHGIVINPLGVPLSGPTVVMLDQRELARREGNFEKADSLRKEIVEKDNLTIQDTSGGTIVKPIK